MSNQRALQKRRNLLLSVSKHVRGHCLASPLFFPVTSQESLSCQRQVQADDISANLHSPPPPPPSLSLSLSLPPSISLSVSL